MNVYDTIKKKVMTEAPFAFPSAFTTKDVIDNNREITIWEAGMTLLDYFAIHCDQPGEAEILEAAGLRQESPSVGNHIVTKSRGDTVGKHFGDWWKNVPQEERFRLYAKVRYGLADAMLAERAERMKAVEKR